MTTTDRGPAATAPDQVATLSDLTTLRQELPGTIAAEVEGSDYIPDNFVKQFGPADPRRYGAVEGAGVSALQAAANRAAFIAALSAVNGLNIPVGDWHISGNLPASGSGYVIRGQGRGRTKITQRQDDCAVWVITGSRMRLCDMSITWQTIQTAAQANSAAVDIVSKSTGGILSNSVISGLDVTNCAVGLDLRDSIGYSCTFNNWDVESFAISAMLCDSLTAWTQSEFGVWHIANQPLPYFTGTAVGGTASTMQLPASASSATNYYVGMTLVLTGGSGSGSTIRFITAYDAATRTITFANPAGAAVDNTTTFAIARQATCTEPPFKLMGFTDARLHELAFEFLTLPSTVSAPLYIETVQRVIVDLIRGERVVWRSPNSALWQVSGRCQATILGAAFEYCAALTVLGVTNFYVSRTYAQATVDLFGLEWNGWVLNATARWALQSSANASDRNERPHGGTYFRVKPSGDTNVSPVGQAYDHPGPQRQTAILDRPPTGARGASLDEGNVATYSHNLLDRPDIVRFNSPITQDVSFALDQSNMIAGVTVTVVRGAGCTGANSILVKFGTTTVATLSAAGSSVRVFCDGQGYQVIP